MFKCLLVEDHMTFAVVSVGEGSMDAKGKKEDSRGNAD